MILESQKAAPASTNSIQKLVESAWAARINQEKESCDKYLQLLRKTLVDLQHPTSQLPVRKLLSAKSPIIFLDILSLILSALRGDEREQEYLSLTAKIDECISELYLEQSFWYLFEKAVYALRKGEYLRAIESLSIAQANADTAFRVLCCDINLLACRFALNIPREDLASKIAMGLENVFDSYPVNAIRNQYLAHQATTFFHNAKFKELQKMPVANPSPGQISYLKAYAACLPYAGNLNTTQSFQNIHQAPYRMRTLMGVLHPDDVIPSHFSSWADRFYLWVWRWLVNPESMSLERLMSIIGPLYQSKDLYRFTWEDRQMVRNALLWLSLFDPSSRYRLSSLLGLVGQSMGEEYPIFAYEKLIIYYWLAVRDREITIAGDYLTNIREHFLFSKSTLGLNALLPDHHLRSFKSIDPLYKNLITFLPSNKSQLPVTIDTISFKVQNHDKQLSVVSESITKALEILRGEDSFSIEELVAYTFGISKYDSIIHQGKLFNLLSRIKALVEPYLELKVKFNRIHIKGSWASIGFSGGKSDFRGLTGCVQWRELAYSKMQHLPKSGPNEICNTLALEKSLLTREELEKVVQRSRATVGRLLVSWEKNGLVKRFGKARSTKYELSRYLINEIKEGRYV